LLDNCIKEYNIKFLSKWSDTISFHSWKNEHNPDICYRGENSQTDDVTIYYENGSMYKGPLLNGLYNGKGYFHD